MGQMPIGNVQLLGGTTSGIGSKTWNFLIPNNNIWAGVNISSQALFLDFFSPGQIVVSNAGTVLTGVRPRSSIVTGSGAPTVVNTGQKSTWYCPVAFFEHQ
jgi:acetyltransferase-like isoleucine patch superfamily enzyme